MNWPAIRPALLAVTQTCTGLTSPAAVAWKGTKEMVGMRPAVVANLSVSSPRGVGFDEERRTFNVGADDNDVLVAGMRQFNWAVRIETQSQEDASIALVYADRLRVRIGRKASRAALNAVGLAVADIRPTQVLEGVKLQDRIISAAIIEFTLNGVENDIDDTEGVGNWIESAVIDSNTLDGVDGLPLAVQSHIEVDT